MPPPGAVISGLNERSGGGPQDEKLTIVSTGSGESTRTPALNATLPVPSPTFCAFAYSARPAVRPMNTEGRVSPPVAIVSKISLPAALLYIIAPIAPAAAAL